MLTGFRVAALIAALGLLTAVPAAPAAAGGLADCGDAAGVIGDRVCEVTAKPPSAPGSGTVGTPVSGGSGSKKPGTRTCDHGGVKVDCVTEFGGWVPAKNCWVKPMSPQPPKTSSVWEGHTQGTIYWATCPDTFNLSTIGGDHAFWGPAAGAGGAPALVNPADLADEAVDAMRLVGARVGATPLVPDAPGVVGVQTWLWIDGADERSWGPATATASSGGVSVTATATATKVVWDTGDGSTVTCRSPGTVWTRARGAADSPTCGHTYLADSGDQPAGAYQITATTHWRVDWVGAGQSGVITFTLTGPPRPLEVVELQALRTA